MSSVSRVGSLEVGEDLEFQRRMWAIQRVAWAVMGLLLLLALLGLFGPGPLSSARVGDRGDPARLEYRRFERLASPTTLRVQVAPGAAREGTVQVALDRRYLEGVRVQRVTPEPDQVEAEGDRLLYGFKIARPDQP